MITGIWTICSKSQDKCTCCIQLFYSANKNRNGSITWKKKKMVYPIIMQKYGTLNSCSSLWVALYIYILNNLQMIPWIFVSSFLKLLPVVFSERPSAWVREKNALHDSLHWFISFFSYGLHMLRYIHISLKSFLPF